MVTDELKSAYFDWICQLVYDPKFHNRRESYHKLLLRLFEEEFRFRLPMDENRAFDGTELRYRFGREMRIPESRIRKDLDDRPCCILEMMAALAIRCDEQIMYNAEVGSQIGTWFWEMIESLGLGSMSDRNYRAARVESIIDTFLRRDYQKNGKGGLFYTRRQDVDMRNLEIWYQMCWYLNNEL